MNASGAPREAYERARFVFLFFLARPNLSAYSDPLLALLPSLTDGSAFITLIESRP